MGTTVSNHLQKAAAAVLVLGVFLQMRGQIINTLAEDSNLHLRRAGISAVHGHFLYDFLLFLLRKHVSQMIAHPSNLRNPLPVAYYI
ncbi:MAG: hypothetical protein QG621_354 [Patescibacteria group bacterium]|nr:hypothetical protein [Patescibacteria group bacterium]